NITNEIINPFSSIMGLAKNIMSLEEPDWKQVKSMVSMIYYEAFNLDFQLRNIFVAARLEAGEIYPEVLNVDVRKLLESVIDAFKYELDKKNMKVEFNCNVKPSKGVVYYFKTDPEKVKLIISNLLSNAVKYSYEDSNVVVKTWESDEKLFISVKDYGTGISKENQEIIFDRFKKLDSGINSVYRGHGLGLSINKALIDLLNGDINIQTEKGKGSEFIISIPEMQNNISGFAFDDNETFFGKEDFIQEGDDEVF
ncbi:MAG: HAMP domain-containing histidine kinase, partial [Bacteroidales bacterium]|nr:HAMP domain-containing histidine kinase [Bacteroidales bacterium]